MERRHGAYGVLRKGKPGKRRRQRVCAWCKDEERPVQTSDLCGSCYRFKLNLGKADAALRQARSAGATKDRIREFEWKLFYRKRLVELAKLEGDSYGDVDTKEIDGLWLELEFRRLTKRLFKKEIFVGHSNAFDWDFTLAQRRTIFGYLARMQRIFLRRHRAAFARRTAELSSGWQSML